MLRVTNPVVRLLLRSPVGGPMRRQFMVLRFYGRKTGQRYYIPVVAHRLGEELYSLTDARWRHNFRDGADVEVTLDGHVTRMRGQLLEDPAGCRAHLRAQHRPIRCQESAADARTQDPHPGNAVGRGARRGC